MKFWDFIGLFDNGKSGQIILEIDGVAKAQEISTDALPLMEGIKDWIIAYFWIEDGILAMRLEKDERPF